MPKTGLLIIGVGAIFIVVLFIAIYLADYRGGYQGNAVADKETALKIGRALLEEHYPDDFSYPEKRIEAKEKGGIWRVYEFVDREPRVIDDVTYGTLSGEIYVEFRKRDGKVLRIGFDD